MGLIQPKQIQKILAGVIKFTGLTAAISTGSTVVTTQLATALSTAAAGGGSVALLNSTNNTLPGIPTSVPGNKCEIWNSTTKEKLATASGNYEIYGRLSFASSIWTLSYYYLDGTGTEQSYTFLANTTIDVDFVYRFQFTDFPTDGLVAILTRNVYFDPVGSGAAAIFEKLTVTSTNTLANISQAPGFPLKTLLFVNGKTEVAVGLTPPFTISGNVVTWNQSNAGYILETTDDVTIEYYV
jgi:LysM repeat protein